MDLGKGGAPPFEGVPFLRYQTPEVLVPVLVVGYFQK